MRIKTKNKTYCVHEHYNISADGSISVDNNKKSVLERLEALEQIIL